MSLDKSLDATFLSKVEQSIGRDFLKAVVKINRSVVTMIKSDRRLDNYVTEAMIS